MEERAFGRGDEGAKAVEVLGIDDASVFGRMLGVVGVG